MSKQVDPRFSQDDGINVYTGNELLVKGALEAGVALYSSYPGSPVAETLDVIRANAALFVEHGIEAAVANNEALAAARINGSQALPVRAMAIMKCVGYNVALDVFETSNLAGANPGGGAVAVVGDDPTCSSTQAPADSRYKARSIFMPVIMPSTWQEIKDWVDKAFRLSAASELYVTYLVTTAQAGRRRYGAPESQCLPGNFQRQQGRSRYVGTGSRAAGDDPAGIEPGRGTPSGAAPAPSDGQRPQAWPGQYDRS